MRIIGTGSALPKKIVTNEMLSEFLDTSDEWITTRTGIKSRHVISDERLEDLGAEAAMKALEMSGLGVEDIDLFIVSNVVSEHITPDELRRGRENRPQMSHVRHQLRLPWIHICP